jgi:hypothetical protein
MKCAKCILGVIVLVTGFHFSACVGSVAIREMDITTDIRSSQILNLKNYGDTNIDFLRQSEKLMKNGFLHTMTEEYGYYVVDYSVDDRNYDSGWPYLHIFTFYTLILFGVPTHSNIFDLYASLKIFDSNGVLVKTYRDNTSFTQTAGLYYGHNPTKRAEKEFKKLFTNILQMASIQSGEINQALLAAGPVTQEKDSIAKGKIASYSSSRYASVPSYSYSDEPSSSSSSSSISTPTPSIPTLRAGRYACSGTDVTMELNTTMKFVTLYIGYTTVGNGTYTLSGNNIVITIIQANDPVSFMKGRTYAYTIMSNTSFSGSGETWVRR